MLRFGLASDGVCMCPARYRAGGSLLHCPSNLTGKIPAVGLSSPGTFRSAGSGRLSCLPEHSNTGQAAFASGSPQHAILLSWQLSLSAAAELYEL